MDEREFDIFEVEIAPPNKERLMDTVKGQGRANEYIRMAVIRRGVENHFYVARQR